MVKLIHISGRKLCRILVKLGFEHHGRTPKNFPRKFLQGAKIHGKGSHVRFKHPDGRRTVVPVHANEDLGKGLLREILKQIKLSKEKYEELRIRI